MLSASALNAANITIDDHSSSHTLPAEWTGGAGDVTYSPQTSGWWRGAPGTVGREKYQDINEVEPGHQTGAAWDLAAFVTPQANKLGVISAFNLASGHAGESIGDIFVSTRPRSLNLSVPPQSSAFVSNALYNYDFALRFDFSSLTYAVIKLHSNSLLDNVGVNFTGPDNTGNSYRVFGSSGPLRSSFIGPLVVADWVRQGLPEPLSGGQIDSIIAVNSMTYSASNTTQTFMRNLNSLRTSSTIPLGATTSTRMASKLGMGLGWIMPTNITRSSKEWNG